MQNYLVRIGVLGQIGRFHVPDAVRYARGTHVICRTDRGLEFGCVLNVIHSNSVAPTQAGTILRRAAPEDHLLWARIEKNRREAMDACQQLLDDRATGTVLMDVDLLFDGKSIFFYYLGKVTTEVASLTHELAETYASQVQLREFSEALTLGCGPDCGTAVGGQCDTTDGPGGCHGCSVSAACSQKPANTSISDVGI